MNTSPTTFATDIPAATYPRLVADVGGTHARFGWLPRPGVGVVQVQRLRVADYPGLAEAAQAYLAMRRQPPLAEEDQGHHQPLHAAIAVATAVEGDVVRFTNSHWHCTRPGLQAALGLHSLLLLNDFEAQALSLPCLGPSQWRVIGRHAPVAAGTLAVLGPGTGLGVGAVRATAAGWVALAGEGGHATLAPVDDLESTLLAVVRRQYAHVSAERLLSGIGLPVLHQALGEVMGRPVAQAWAADAIVAEGLANVGSLGSAAIDLFCAMLGGFAGNVALTLGARNGVFIGGGIVPRLGERFFQSAFRERFEAKGRFRAYLEATPTALITDTLAALSGAALAIEQHLRLRPG